MTGPSCQLSDWISSRAKVLDLRSADAFYARRLSRSHNIPEQDLKSRLFELPDGNTQFAILLPRVRQKDWIDVLREKWNVAYIFEDSEDLWQLAHAAGVVDTGMPQSLVLLFQPCPVLEANINIIEQPADSLRTCLDIGCGSGRDIIYLAARGWKVHGIDNWKGAVRRATAAAHNYGLSDRMTITRASIEPDGHLKGYDGSEEQAQAAIAGKYSLVLCVRFLSRGFFEQMRRAVARGGFLLVSTFVEDDNCNPEVAKLYPSKDCHVLKQSELAESFGPAQGFCIVCNTINDLHDSRLVTCFLAQKM